MSPLSSQLLLAAVVFVAAALTVRAIRHAINNAPQADPQPSTLDTLDNPNRCNERHPHRMLPTSYGWRCANNCGESWWVDDGDILSTADLQMWERENGWQVQS